MDERQLAEFLPDLAQQYLEGTTGFQALATEGLDTLMRNDQAPYGAWSFRDQNSALVVLSIYSGAILAITAGLALDVPYDSEVIGHLNELNAEFVPVGRLFLKKLDRGAIFMQELAYCKDVPADHLPSLQTLIHLVGKVSGIAGRLSPDLCERFGGHPPPDDADLLILMNA